MNNKGIQRFYNVLFSLGFSSYQDYLSSELWHAIRTKALHAHKHQCLLCPLAATQVHHTSYRRGVLVGESFAELIPLCRDCHDKIEFVKERKRTLNQAKRAFREEWKKLPAWVKRRFNKAVRLIRESEQ